MTKQQAGLSTFFPLTQLYLRAKYLYLLPIKSNIKHKHTVQSPAACQIATYKVLQTSPRSVSVGKGQGLQDSGRKPAHFFQI